MRDGPRAANMMDLSSKEYAMRSYFARGVLLSLGFVLATAAPSLTLGQEFGSPSLLPISTDQFFSTIPVAHQDSVVIEAGPGENPALDTLPSPSDANVQAPPSYKEALQQWGSDSCTTGVAGDYGYGCGSCRGYWFGSVGGLVLGAPTRSSTYLTYNANNFMPVMQTGDTNGVFSGGVDVTLGRMFGCGNWGTAFTYWGVYPSDQTADIYNTAYPIGAYVDFSGIDYNGNPGTLYWNNVFHQRIVTTQAINSVEWNLLGNCGCGSGLFGCSPSHCGPCGPRLGAGWMAGVRYFQFNDDFRFYSDNADNVLDGSVNEMQYNISTRNNLFGFQVGGGLNYRVCNCFSVYGIGKAGIYGNNVIVDQALYGSAGDATVNNGPYTGTAYRFQSSQTSLAFLGQLDLGGSYKINNCWSINGGYRMVGVSGLALTDGQIPNNFAYIPDAQRVHDSDCLILHGGYVGASFCW
jgi:hypothetical protein